MSKPLLYMCPICEQGYPLLLQSTIRLYVNPPWVHHVVTSCPNCHHQTLIWDLHDTVIRDIVTEVLKTTKLVRTDKAPSERTLDQYQAECAWLYTFLNQEE